MIWKSTALIYNEALFTGQSPHNICTFQNLQNAYVCCMCNISCILFIKQQQHGNHIGVEDKHNSSIIVKFAVSSYNFMWNGFVPLITTYCLILMYNVVEYYY
jgi:hypothetical protein